MFASLLLAAAPLLQGEVVATARFVPDSAPAGAPVELHVMLDIAPGFHVYHPDQNPMDGIPVSVNVPTGFSANGELKSLSAPDLHEDIFGSTTVAYLWLTGKAELVLPLIKDSGNLGAHDVAVEVGVQVCDDSLCFPPSTVKTKATFEGEDGEFVASGSTEITVEFPSSVESVQSGESKEDPSLWAFLLLAIGGGLFALMMPCTYPMIPITISFFTKQADARGGNVMPLSLAYGGGIVAIFVLIGVMIGPLVLAFATHAVTNLVIGAMFLVFALALFGVITLNPPQALMGAAGKASATGGYLGVFLMGATLVITSFTCTAPFVGSLLSFGASSGSMLRVALGMGVFGLTMAIPFVFLSLVPGKIKQMPQSGQWMDTIKVTLGFVELAAALKFISNADIVWGLELLSRETFLAAWTIIMLAAALYLFGVLRKGPKPKVGAKRAFTGLCFVAFSAYCAWGWNGAQMDTVMTAIIPNYHSSGEHKAAHAVVIDDLEAAKTQAVESGKLVLVNFTGHT